MALMQGRRQALPRVGRADFEQVVLQSDPEKTTLVLFDTGSEEDGFTAVALAGVQRAHRDRLRALTAPAAEFTSHFDQLESGRRAFDSFNFKRWPVVGVYRQGKLLTTFHPRRVFYVPKLQQRETRTQLDVFLKKFVFFDPSRVRVQTNLEVVEKEEHEKKEG